MSLSNHNNDSSFTTNSDDEIQRMLLLQQEEEEQQQRRHDEIDESTLDLCGTKQYYIDITSMVASTNNKRSDDKNDQHKDHTKDDETHLEEMKWEILQDICQEIITKHDTTYSTTMLVYCNNTDEVHTLYMKMKQLSFVTTTIATTASLTDQVDSDTNGGVDSSEGRKLFYVMAMPPEDVNHDHVMRKKQVDTAIDQFNASTSMMNRVGRSMHKMLITTRLPLIHSRIMLLAYMPLIINYNMPVITLSSSSSRDAIREYLLRIGRCGHFGRKRVCINLICKPIELTLQKQIAELYATEMSELPSGFVEDL